MGQIIDGKAVSAKVKEEIRLETEKLKEQGIEIGLAVVIVCLLYTSTRKQEESTLLTRCHMET